MNKLLLAHTFLLRSMTVWTLTALMFSSFAPSGVKAQNTRQLVQEESKNQQKRIALIIGNGAYTKAKPLPNPTNDATDMAAALKSLGFEVLAGTNLDKRGMETLIREFGNKLSNGSVGLFYYAGHGIQVSGENYLVPVDADIPEEDEVSYSTVPVNLVLRKMATAQNDLNIVILDACRNNPFARSWRTFRDNSNNDGLAKISPPTGTLVLYATEPGKVASDGAGKNGLFTEALLKQIKKPDLEYDQMVKAVSADVWQKSNKQQLPWKEGNTLADFYFVKTESNTNTTKTQPTASNKTESAIPSVVKSAESNNQTENSAAEGGVPNNTKITAILNTSISTKTSLAGDRFTMEVTSPSQFNGAIIEGRVVKTGSSAAISDNVWVWLEFSAIRYRNGQTYRFSGTVDRVRLTNGKNITVINNSKDKDNQTDQTKRKEIGAGLGALIGGITGSDAPFGTVVLKGTDKIEIDNGTEFMLLSIAPVNTNNTP